MSFQSSTISLKAQRNSSAPKVRQLRGEETPFEESIKANIERMQASRRYADEALQTFSRGQLSRSLAAKVDDSLDRCRELEQETERTFREWTIHMAGEPMERHRKKFVFDRLRKAFEEESLLLKALGRRASAARPTAAEYSTIHDEPAVMHRVAPDELHRHDEVGREDSVSDNVMVQNTMAREREEGIKRIQSQMACVHQVFKDIAGIVTEQGRQLETVEQQAQESSASTAQAVGEMRKAAIQQGSTAHLWFVIVAILLFIALGMSTYLLSSPVVPQLDNIAKFQTGVQNTNPLATRFGTAVISKGNLLV